MKKVAIVGGGIIGLYLAWRLRGKGYDITVFERNNELGGKICSGLVSTRIKKFIDIDDSLIQNEINSTIIHFSRKDIKLKLFPQHIVLKRDKVIVKLANLVRQGGGEIVLGKEINNFSVLKDKFDFIIGCDGSLSKIRREMRLRDPNFYLGLQVIVKKRDLSHKAEVWPFKSGFFWKIPQGDSVNLGALGFSLGLIDGFKDFCLRQGIKTNEYNIQSAPIPQGLVLSDRNNIFLCGDASGLTKPWSGGGIIWGLTEAGILLNSFPHSQKYRYQVNKFFRMRIIKGRIMTHLVYFVGRNVPFLLPSRVTRDNDFPLL